MTVRLLSDAPAPHTELQATVCVIGAGIAGLFAARRLAARGHRVVLLESGLRSFDQDIHNLNAVEDPGGQFSHAMVGRYRGLGGSSSQWGGRMVPMTPHDMAARPYLGLEAWPFDTRELEKYRAEIEKAFVIVDGSFEEDVLDTLDWRGRIRRGDPDFTLRYPKWPTFTRCNLAVQFADEIRDNPKMEIWLGATVDSFTRDDAGGRLTAVTARDFAGRTVRVQADQFLFAAGTIETTRLLLQLDRASQGRVFESCDALGRYFNDHLGATVGFLDPRDWATTIRWFGYYFTDATRRNLHIETTPRAQEEDRVPSSFAQVFLNPPEKSGLNVIKNVLRGLQRRELDLRPRDLLYLLKDAWPMAMTGYWRYARNQLYIPKNMPLSLNIWTEQVPQWKNHIALSDRLDAMGSPKTRILWHADEGDERAFRACLKRLGPYWERAGLAQACPVRWSAEALDPALSVAAGAEDLGHPSGTTRMGRDKKASVVDLDLACHHIANGWIASASVFPTMGSANPTYTIIQIALRAADSIAARLVA